jgi:hypothetical protein
MRYLILKKRKNLGEPDAPKVEWLTAVGSQRPLPYELDVLKAIRHSQFLLDSFAANDPNIYDLRDFLSYVGEKLFPERVVGVSVDNARPFQQSRSADWANSMVWSTILTRVKPR